MDKRARLYGSYARALRLGRAAAGALVLVLATAACSLLSVAYNNAPTAIAWSAQDWFDFDGPQKTLLSARTEALHAWHRKQELPEYAKLVQRVAERVGNAGTPFAEAEVQGLFDEVQGKFRTTGARAAQEASALGALLHAENLKAFDARVAKVNADFTRDYLTPPLAKVKKKRLERIIESSENWLGTLSEAQKQRLGEEVDALPTQFALILEDRQRRQRILRGIVQSAIDKSASPSELAGRLQAWATQWEAGRSTAYQRYSTQTQAQSTKMYTTLANSASAEQRAYALKKLKSTSDELLALVQAQ